MKFEDYTKSLNELMEQLKQANDKLAAAQDEDATNEAIKEVSEINEKIAKLKDDFISDQNQAYADMEARYNKSEQERLQALKIASDNANKKQPEEKDPRVIFSKGIGGI